jgi:hypothetical protein
MSETKSFYETGYSDALQDTTKFLKSKPSDDELLQSDYTGWYVREYVPKDEYEEGYADGVGHVFREYEFGKEAEGR